MTSTRSEGDPKMKTIKARRAYTCRQCKTPIEKGDTYARKSVTLGQRGMAGSDGTVHHWEPYRTTVTICEQCANA